MIRIVKMKTMEKTSLKASISKTPVKWMISYILVMFVPLLFGTVIYIYSMTTIKSEAEDIQYHTVSYAADNMLAVFDNFTEMSKSILSENKIIDLSGVKVGEFNITQRVYMKEMIDKINDYVYSNDYLSNVFVYLHGSQYVLGNNGLFYAYDPKMIYQRMGISDSAFNKLSDPNAVDNVYVVNDYGIDNPYFVYRTKNLTLFLKINQSKLRSLLGIEQSISYMYIKNGDILSDTYVPYSTYAERIQPLLGNKYVYKTIGNDNYLVVPLGKYGITIIHIIPKHVYMQKLEYAKIIMLVYIVLSMVIGILFSNYITKKNYSPVDELIKMTQRGNLKSEGQKDDFLAIKESVSKLLNAYETGNEEKRNRELQIRSNRFARIIENNRFAKISEREFKEITAKFRFDSYVLVDFNISDISDIFTETEEYVSEETRRLIYFIIDNVCTEIFADRYDFIGAEFRGNYMFLVNVDGRQKDELIYEDLTEIATKAHDFLKANYGLNIWVNISKIHESRNGIGKCRDEVAELTLFRDWIGTDKDIICYNNFNREDFVGFDVYTQEKEARDALRNHDYKEAVAIIKRISGEEEAEIATPPETEGKSGSDVMQDITEYIDKNYTDPRLSAGMIADIYGMSPSNLSQTFKRKMDIGLLDYINQKRLETAKGYLKSGMSVKETAEKVGYYTTRPLIRVFYQVENVSPAEYRSRYIE
jgi:AraC-like DNA-binding protein